METNGNDAASPVVAGNVIMGQGLTKREQFAMAAMQGYVMAEHERYHIYMAKDAVAMAEALIAALNEGGADNG
jgi:hypothetical protein